LTDRPGADYSNAMPSDPVALAQSLIRCPSVTPEEGGALALLETVLSGAGFSAHRMTFSQPGTPDVQNLYARIGSAGPVLAFAGHTDVVPAGDPARWTHPPFSGEIAGGELFGRGAVDMKGGIAAFTAAALRFAAKHPGFPGSIAFLITGDEEGPSVNGTPKLLAWAAEQGERFDHCLLGEPTNPHALGDAVKIGRRGSLSGILTVHGVQGHVAYPHLADNPVRGMMKLLAALMDEPLDSGSEHFEPSNLEVASVDVGNPAFNVIPAEARARFNVRFNDRYTADSLKAPLTARIEAAAAGKIRYGLDFEPTVSHCFLTAPGPFVDLVVDAVEEVTGRRPVLATNGGTSDARYIKDFCPVVEFGLVGETMHQVDERASVADIERLTEIYERVLERYFAVG
jgi:succinyl-diaminopimelate desuccinylase